MLGATQDDAAVTVAKTLCGNGCLATRLMPVTTLRTAAARKPAPSKTTPDALMMSPNSGACERARRALRPGAWARWAR